MDATRSRWNLPLTFLEDLRRRDFTINAMAYSHATGIVDAFDGMADLKARRIRCVGNAMERFTERRAAHFAGYPFFRPAGF